MRHNCLQTLSLLFLVMIIFIPNLMNCYRLDDDGEKSTDNNEIGVSDGKKLQTALKIVKAYLEYQIDEIDSIINREGFLQISDLNF